MPIAFFDTVDAGVPAHIMVLFRVGFGAGVAAVILVKLGEEVTNFEVEEESTFVCMDILKLLL